LEREFLELQARFARRAASIRGLSELEAFRIYTTFYGIAHDNDAGSPSDRWSFDPDHAAWRGLVDVTRGGDDPVDHVDRALQALERRSDERRRSTCFEYDYWPGERLIRLHFGNTSDGSGLSSQSIPERHGELRALFMEIAHAHPRATAVRGTSWLYHLDAYRRLFPTGYVERLEPAGHLHQFLALWGQFLDRHGRVKVSLAGPFLDQVNRATSIGDLNAAFPFDVLRTTCPIEHFYRHYAVAGWT
jgi:hypothetical protein